jgi:CBS domain-containing protein
MEDIFVGRIMSSPVATTLRKTPIHEAAQTMVDQDIGSLIIVDEDDSPEGILTSTDFVHLAADRAAIDVTVVEEYMTPIDTATTANKPIREAADKMMTRGIHHVPVVDDDQSVIGILTTTDLTAYLSDDWTPSPS